MAKVGAKGKARPRTQGSRKAQKPTKGQPSAAVDHLAGQLARLREIGRDLLTALSAERNAMALLSRSMIAQTEDDAGAAAVASEQLALAQARLTKACDAMAAAVSQT